MLTFLKSKKMRRTLEAIATFQTNGISEKTHQIQPERKQYLDAVQHERCMHVLLADCFDK